MAFTSGNDINILQAADSTNVGAGAGNDRYVLDSSILSAGQQITITDTGGTNTLQLVGGLVITSSIATSDTLQLTLSNGAVVTVLGANNFIFQTGGNAITGTGGTPQPYGTFLTGSLGFAAVPAGTTPVNGTTQTVNPNGGTGPIVVVPVGLTITTSAGVLTESGLTTLQAPANMAFTVTLSAVQTTATTVNFTTSSAATANAATPASDYTATTGSVVIAAGQTTGTFTVPVLDDLIFDGTLANPSGVEVFTVTLSLPVGAAGTLVNTTTTGTITDGEINAQPVNTLPATAPNALLSTTAAIPGIVVADANNATLTTVVTATNGLLSAPATGALATAVSGVTSITLTGSIANINTSLAALTYVSSRTIPGVDSLTVVTTDGLGGSASSTVNINVSGGGVFTTLTTDAFVGTAANEFYSGIANTTGLGVTPAFTLTIDATDTLAAAGGTDTLTITEVNGATGGVQFTGLEVLNLTTVIAPTQATVNVNVATKFDPNLTTINYTDGSTALASRDTTLVLVDVNTASTVTLNSSLATSADIEMLTATGTLTLALSGGVTVPSLLATGQAPTTYNIQSNGAAANIITSATTAFLATTNVALSGAQALTLNIGAVAAPLTINGTAAIGALTISNAASTATATTITGGSANDVLTGSSTIANTLVGGAGNDTITGGAAADIINGGLGDDIINGGVGAADVSITGGLGRDTITVNQSGDTVIIAVGDTGTVAANTADVIVGLRDGVRIDLTNYVAGGGFIANGNLVTATTGASATLRDIYINAANKSIVIEMDAAGTTTQEIVIGAGAAATIANVGGILTFGPVPLVASVASGVVVVEGQNATGANVVVTLATAIPQIGTPAVNVNGATTSIANLNGSAVSGAFGLTIIGSTVANTIVGSSAADNITGGTGLDVLTGGAGVDTFVFDGTAGVNTSGSTATFGQFDTITDFVVGTDKLQFVLVTDVVSGQQAAVQVAVTALAAGSTDLTIFTAMALANTTNLGVSIATFGGNSYVLYETTGADTAATVNTQTNDVLIKLTGVSVAPTFLVDVIA